MEQENIDPVYSYVDKKFKELKRELKQLKVNNDEIIKKFLGIILNMQQAMVSWQINSNVQTYGDIISEKLPGRNELFTQLVADAVKAKSEASKSNLPFEISTAFQNKWVNILEKAGAKIINF